VGVDRRVVAQLKLSYNRSGVTSLSEKMQILKGSMDLDLLESSLDIEVVRQMGSEDVCRCPLPSHNGVDSNPSFMINRDRLVYNCFACGVGGTIIDLVARVMNVDYDEAYRFCRSYGESSLGNDDPQSFSKRLNAIFSEQSAKSDFVPFPRFSTNVIDQWLHEPCDYFASRGITEESRELYSLGFDPAHRRGSYTGPAVVIPHFFDGALVGYQERWLDPERPKDIPKYTNSRNFPKGETLFGFDIAIGNNSSPVVVVESAFTAIYVNQVGLPAVATFGAQVTDYQIHLLKSFSWGATLSFDNDSAGQGACSLVAERLRKTIPIHIVDPPEGDKADLNDLSEEGVLESIRSAKPWFMKEI